jgi:hypothetical protein
MTEADYMRDLLAAIAALDAKLVRLQALVEENGKKLDKILCRVGIIR